MENFCNLILYRIFQYCREPVLNLRILIGFEALLKILLQGILILSQEQDKYGGDFSYFNSYSGQITQFNIWNRLVFIAKLVYIENVSLSFS